MVSTKPMCTVNFPCKKTNFTGKKSPEEQLISDFSKNYGKGFQKDNSKIKKITGLALVGASIGAVALHLASPEMVAKLPGGAALKGIVESVVAAIKGLFPKAAEKASKNTEVAADAVKQLVVNA
jgi:hypothetical protein